jgi:phenylacetate-CoA ligase
MFAKAVFETKQKLFRPQAWRAYRHMLDTQSRSLDQLSSINWLKRVKIVQHAYQTSRLYQNKFKAVGFLPGDLRKPEDWYSLPILTKSDIINSFSEILSSAVDPGLGRLSTTGGSTGEPIKVLHDRRFPLETLGWRMMNWWGVHPSVNAGFVWRITRTRQSERLFNHLVWWPTRRYFLDASSMTEEDVVSFVNCINRGQVSILQGYVGALQYVAEIISSRGLKLQPPLAVWVTSAPLAGGIRGFMERVFQAPVYDQYGCGEVFWIAAECKNRTGLHWFIDCRHVEVVNDSNVDTLGSGRILITDLENFVFPIIRYENGDRGSHRTDRCACGISLPLLDSVAGRITDMLDLPGGGKIAGDFLTTIFDPYPGAVRSFQVRQRSDGSIVIYYVPNHGANSLEAVALVLERVRLATKGLVEVTAEEARIIHSDRGKHRYVIRDVLRSS